MKREFITIRGIMDISFLDYVTLVIKKTVVHLFVNITTSVGDFNKFSYFQGVVDGSVSAKRYFS